MLVRFSNYLLMAEKLLLPFSLFLFLCALIGFDLLSGKIHIHGDILFPIYLQEQITSRSYTFFEDYKNGLGGSAFYRFVFESIYLQFIDLLISLGLPLKSINVLHLLLPKLAIFCFSYSLFKKINNCKDASLACGLAAMLYMVSPSFYYSAPALDYAVACSIGVLVVVVNLYKSPTWIMSICLGLLSVPLLAMPRFLVITAVLVAFTLLIFVFSGPARMVATSFQTLKAIKVLSAAFILGLLLNLPTFALFAWDWFYAEGPKQIFASNQALDTRLSLFDFYQGRTGFTYIATLGVNNQYSPFLFYLDRAPFFGLISTFFFLLSMVPTLLQRIRFQTLLILLLYGFTFGWCFLFGSRIYKDLALFVPGLWIINSPVYILVFTGLFQFCLISVTLERLKEIATRYAFFSKANSFYVLSVAFLAICIMPFSAWHFSKDNMTYTSNSIPGLIRSGGLDLPGAVVPKEYFSYHYATTLEPGTRTAFLPNLKTPYVRYAWWPYDFVPVIFSFNPKNRMLTGAQEVSASINEELFIAIANNQHERYRAIASAFQIRRVIVSKDILPSQNVDTGLLKLTSDRLHSSPYFSKVFSSTSFDVFEYHGDIDNFVTLTNCRSYLSSLNFDLLSNLRCENDNPDKGQKLTINHSKNSADSEPLQSVRYGPAHYFIKIATDNQKEFLNLNEGFSENLRMFEGAEFERYFDICSEDQNDKETCIDFYTELRLFLKSLNGVPSFVSNGWSNGWELRELQGQTFVIYDQGHFVYKVSKLCSTWLISLLLGALGLVFLFGVLRKVKSWSAR